MGPHEPYWRTNTSFSPPPGRWDFQLQPENLLYGSLDGSATSSNSKESRSWVRGNQLYSSDGGGIFLSGSPEVSQRTPPSIQQIRVDGRRGMALGPSSFKTTIEGTSEIPDSGGSTSFHSDSSESEAKSRFSSHRSFMSKPIHPLLFTRRTSPDSAAQSGAQSWSSTGSSMDFADISETFESEKGYRACNPSSEALRCCLCERLLSQRSPWSSRRIVRSGDMPVISVLPCSHAFHAECLEQTTPKTRKSEPPCPLCLKSEEEKMCSRARNNLPRLRPCSEDGPSRPWGCVQVGDCVEGALHLPQRNSVLLLNRNRMKKTLSLKGSSSRELPGKLRKKGSLPGSNRGCVRSQSQRFSQSPA